MRMLAQSVNLFKSYTSTDENKNFYIKIQYIFKQKTNTLKRKVRIYIYVYMYIIHQIGISPPSPMGEGTSFGVFQIQKILQGKIILLNLIINLLTIWSVNYFLYRKKTMRYLFFLFVNILSKYGNSQTKNKFILIKG